MYRLQSTFMQYTWQCSTENWTAPLYGDYAFLLQGYWMAGQLSFGMERLEFTSNIYCSQPSCQRRAALWFSPWTTSLDLLQSAVTSCSYHFPWMLLCFLACSFKSPWSVYILAYCKALWSKSGYASEYAQIRTMLKKLTVTFEFAPCRFAIINAMWSQITCL